MKLKRFISLLCLVVLMFQVLPVKQIGKMLSSNQLQEELPHGADDVEKDMKGKLDFKKEFCSAHSFAELNYINVSADCYIHFATALPLTHAGEIHTPPPNTASFLI